MKRVGWLKVPLVLLVAGVLTFTLASAWVTDPHPPAAAVRPSPPAPPTVGQAIQAAPPPTPTQALATPETLPVGPPLKAYRGVYLTANAAGDAAWLDGVIAKSTSVGFNAIVIDVKDNSGALAYPSNVPLARQLGAVSPRYDLPALVAKLHGHGLAFIARLVVFSDPLLARHQGRADAWVRADNAQAVAYNLAVAAEVAAAGVDEIQFDYIRFADDGPLGRPYAERNAAVAGFAAQARGQLGDGVRLSADVFGRTLWDWNPKGMDPIGQVLEQLAPYMDALSPMIYPSHYETDFQSRPYEVVKRGMGVGLLRGLALRPFLQAFKMRLPAGMTMGQYIRAQLRALQELGVDGYLFWNPQADYTELWSALAGRS